MLGPKAQAPSREMIQMNLLASSACSISTGSRGLDEPISISDGS